MSRQSYSANQYSGGRSTTSSPSRSTSAPTGGGGGRDYSPPTVVSTPTVAPPSISQASIEVGIPDIESGFVDPLGTIPAAPNIFDINVLGDPALRGIPTGVDLEEGMDTAVGADFTPTQTKSLGDALIDYVKGGGMIGMALRGIGGLLGMNSTNQYEGITGEDGLGEGDYISTVDDFAQDRLGMNYDELDVEGQEFVDQQMYNAGVRTPAFQNLYEGGDTSNLNQLSSSERDAVSNIVPQLSYAISGQTPQQSMVNQYFANLGMSQGSPLSSKLQTDYNNAKNNINSILGVNQQFGYSTDPYGGLMASNLADNPFNIEYMRTRGLI